MPPSKEFLDLVGKMSEVHVKKNQDYSGDNDAFYNFDFAASIVSHFKNPIDQVFISLICIKLARLAVLSNNMAVPQNEAIEDSFLDATNYMALWGARRSRDFKPISEAQVLHDKIMADANKVLERTDVTSVNTAQEYERKKQLMLDSGFIYNNALGHWFTDKYSARIKLESEYVIRWEFAELEQWIKRIDSGVLPKR